VRGRAALGSELDRLEDRLRSGDEPERVISVFAFAVLSHARWPHELLGVGGAAVAAGVFAHFADVLSEAAPGPTTHHASACSYLAALVVLGASGFYALFAIAFAWLERRSQARLLAALDGAVPARPPAAQRP
jgi:hypothetical protein